MNTKETAQTRNALPAERRQAILDTLRRDGKVLASELAETLAISEDTVRRDLKELAEAGLLQRVHGGALPRSPVPLDYRDRRGRDLDAKRAIGRAAAALVGTRDTVLLDGGTTNLEVARALPPGYRGTVVTSSLPAALAVSEHPGAEVVVLGGRLLKPLLSCVGHRVAEELARVRADLCFFGAASLDPGSGAGSLDYEEVQAKRAMIAVAARVVAVLSGEKLGTASPFVVASMAEIDVLVTDATAPADVVERCRAQGVGVVVG